MSRVTDSLEALLVYHGSGAASPEAERAESKRHGLRHLIEVLFGQLIGVLVAIWCIMRSVDSLLGGATGPPPPEEDSEYVPGVRLVAVASGKASGSGLSSGSSLPEHAALLSTPPRNRGAIRESISGKSARKANQWQRAEQIHHVFACKVR